ncbi:MAG TPA: single-stranded DNA-binding protein [Micromonosporaceae bacterium]|nr:single-stranded DNA-binding protein [Micromonosporaceae bacterium]
MMFDTYLTIVGNVLTAPQWRRTTQTNALVANFKVASTSRRFDREANRWTDGNSVRVRVNCWRRLAEGVASSLMVGDPVIVVGRLYTREWTDEHQQRRLMYEMEAVAVGHDLARGRGKFYRTRPNTSTSMVESGDAEARVNGEPTEQVRNDEAPATFGAGLPHDPDDFDVLSGSALAYDPLGALGYAPALGSTASGDGEDGYAREGVAAGDGDGEGLDGEQIGGGRLGGDEHDGAGFGGAVVVGGEEQASSGDPDGADARRGRRRVRTPVPA